ncbi:MAG: hypothetical protein LBI03_03240 [Clostridiales bacterium]|jgi:hypothetical protein|nr:hypothetical protein [Clostridiales bacterium]
MIQDKKPKVYRGTFRIFFGALCVAFGLIGFSSSIDDGFDSVDISMILMFLGGGALLLFFGVKAKMLSLKYNRYASIIANKKQTNLDYIAEQTEDSTQKVSDTLLAMLEVGFFPGAYIDENSRQLILPKEVVSSPTETAQLSTKKCPSCGAVNTVIAGKMNECEYCGSSLNS